MNNIIEQINSICVANTYKLHDLLDRVLMSEYNNFPNREIKFDNEKIAFFTQLDDGFSIIVGRDMNAFTVTSRVVIGNDVVAECILTTDGKVHESYAKMPTELKHTVSNWFDEITNIDVTTLYDGTSFDDDAEKKEDALEEAPSEAKTIPEEEVIEEPIEVEVTEN